jgi:hypothetical protein
MKAHNAPSGHLVLVIVVCSVNTIRPIGKWWFNISSSTTLAATAASCRMRDLEQRDDVPAMLTAGEFVLTKDAVKGLGGGNERTGIENAYRMQRKLEGMA